MPTSTYGQRIRASALFLTFALTTFGDPFGPYSVTPCNGPAQAACSITPGGHIPAAQDVAGLDNTLFVEYFENFIPSLSWLTDPLFAWNPTAANANGYVVGSVWGPEQIHTQFVYHAGQLLCCIADDPFRILGINDNNLIVGTDAGGGFAAFAGASNTYSGGPTFSDPTFDPYVFPFQFIAVDNQNRIIAVGPGQDYMLAPLDPVAEPSSAVLILTLLAGFVASVRCRRLAS